MKQLKAWKRKKLCNPLIILGARHVDKVEFFDLNPLSFVELMIVMGKGQYVDLLRHYYYLDSMLEVVQNFRGEQSLKQF